MIIDAYRRYFQQSSHNLIRELRLVIPAIESQYRYLLIETDRQCCCMTVVKKTRRCATQSIELNKPLDFFGESESWHRLATQLRDFDNCICILPPQLYLLHPAGSEALYDDLFTSSTEYGTHAYSYSTALQTKFSRCRSVLPIAEIVRCYMLRYNAVSWIFAGDSYLWIMDSRSYLHELAYTDSITRRIVNSLFATAVIGKQTFTCAADKGRLAFLQKKKADVHIDTTTGLMRNLLESML